MEIESERKSRMEENKNSLLSKLKAYGTSDHYPLLISFNIKEAEELGEEQ